MEWRSTLPNLFSVVGTTALTAVLVLACSGGDQETLEVPRSDVGEDPRGVGEGVLVIESESQVHAFRNVGPAQGCEVAPLAEPDEDFPEAVFIEACSGALYDPEGTLLFGPGPSRLDEYRIELDGDEVVVHLDDVDCEPSDRTPCPTEPRSD